jgi:hypothetical protein
LSKVQKDGFKGRKIKTVVEQAGATESQHLHDLHACGKARATFAREVSLFSVHRCPLAIESMPALKSPMKKVFSFLCSLLLRQNTCQLKAGAN